MGRAFHDKDGTCTGDSTDESEDESCTLKKTLRAKLLLLP